ncbi:hypothetical protein MAHJHV50_48490 [Mycobacterium avium subsp. hominissuis]
MAIAGGETKWSPRNQPYAAANLEGSRDFLLRAEFNAIVTRLFPILDITLTLTGCRPYFQHHWRNSASGAPAPYAPAIMTEIPSYGRRLQDWDLS